jgi:hypothetical protein
MLGPPPPAAEVTLTQGIIRVSAQDRAPVTRALVFWAHS